MMLNSLCSFPSNNMDQAVINPDYVEKASPIGTWSYGICDLATILGLKRKCTVSSIDWVLTRLKA
jgi:hypothetical protein